MALKNFIHHLGCWKFFLSHIFGWKMCGKNFSQFGRGRVYNFAHLTWNYSLAKFNKDIFSYISGLSRYFCNVVLPIAYFFLSSWKSEKLYLIRIYIVDKWKILCKIMWIILLKFLIYLKIYKAIFIKQLLLNVYLTFYLILFIVRLSITMAPSSSGIICNVSLMKVSDTYLASEKIKGRGSTRYPVCKPLS